jgi:uncharacterized protein (DUF1499 family)
MVGKIIIALILASVAFVMGVRMIVQRAPQPDRIGVAKGRLSPCPESPNCVSSFEGANPFAYQADRALVRTALMEILEDWPRTKVTQSTEDYIHVEFRSRVFSFIDDGEFYLPAADSVVHFRFAARTGHSDMGANAARGEDIRSVLQQTASQR